MSKGECGLCFSDTAVSEECETTEVLHTDSSIEVLTNFADLIISTRDVGVWGEWYVVTWGNGL